MSGTDRPVQEQKSALWWLAQVAGRYKLAVVGIALLDMVLGASSVAYALLFGNLVDRGLPHPVRLEKFQCSLMDLALRFQFSTSPQPRLRFMLHDALPDARHPIVTNPTALCHLCQSGIQCHY